MTILNGNKAKVDRLPAINSVGTYTTHAMNVFDAHWPDAHRHPQKMAHLAAGLHKLAGLENITLPFELTVEAEIFGAPLQFFENEIKWPTVRKFIASEVSDLTFPEDVSTAGRVPIVINAIKTLNREFEGQIPIIAYLNGPFTSISSYLVDPIHFLKSVKRDPETIHNFLQQTYPYYAELATLFKEAGADVITFREEGASLDNISPQTFTEFVQPYLTKIIHLTKPPRILHICGQCVSADGEIEILRDMIACGAEAITIDERTSIQFARKIADQLRPGYPIGGNINPFSVIHAGPPERIRQAVQQVIEEGIDLVAPGCDFWLETPTEHVQTFVEAVAEYGMVM